MKTNKPRPQLCGKSIFRILSTTLVFTFKTLDLNLVKEMASDLSYDSMGNSFPNCITHRNDLQTRFLEPIFPTRVVKISKHPFQKVILFSKNDHNASINILIVWIFHLKDVVGLWQCEKKLSKKLFFECSWFCVAWGFCCYVLGIFYWISNWK